MNSNMQDFLVKSGEELKVIIGKLANSLGVAAEHVYIILIKQEIITGITDIIIFLMFFITMLWLAKSFRRNLRQAEVNDNAYRDAVRSEEDRLYHIKEGSDIKTTIFGITLGICIVVNLFLTVNVFVPGIQRIANPEYYAIQDAINFIHGNTDQINSKK